MWRTLKVWEGVGSPWQALGSPKEAKKPWKTLGGSRPCIPSPFQDAGFQVARSIAFSEAKYTSLGALKLSKLSWNWGLQKTGPAFDSKLFIGIVLGII